VKENPGMNSPTVVAFPRQKQLEDPLAHLPCSTIYDYKKGQVIYGQDNPVDNIFLILSGKVKVSRIAANGRPIIIDVYRADEFFGESAFLGVDCRREVAVAAEPAQLMGWSSDEIERISLTRPKLAIGLMQLQAQRSEEFVQRIVGFSADTIGKRLGSALIRFAERLGWSLSDGSTEMSALTHQFLAEHVGTSREIVTHCMNQLRRQGYVRYSRKTIQVYVGPLKASLLEEV
jgi:CRP/FNR family transcriptional regulator, cyclic AMP receptor protein